MEIIFVILLVIAGIFIFGLLGRKKGDSFLDTMGAGCNVILLMLIIIGFLLFAGYKNWIQF
jgi:hypothetical protein